MSRSLKKIIFHRGNISNSTENTLESLNSDDIHKKLKSKISSNAKYIYEIDVINKCPFLIHHSPYENILDSINLDTQKEFIYEMDHEDIIKAKYYDNSKPIVLKELLEHCRKNKLKVCLDIKHVENYEDDIHEMIKLLNKYSDVIDSVLSFSIDLLLKLKTDLVGIRYGLFISESESESFKKSIIDDTYKYNFIYRITKRQIKSYLKNHFETLIEYFKPSVISIQKDLILHDYVYDSIITKFQENKLNEVYAWTFSQKEMRNEYIIDFLKTKNIIPIFDNNKIAIDFL